MNFVDITSNNNWFKKHPKKIAGLEFTTTSIFFPVQVKGTKEDVLRVTGVVIEKTKRIRIARAKAKAIKIKLLLNEGIYRETY